MSNRGPQMPVVIHVNGVPYGHHNTDAPGHSVGHLVGEPEQRSDQKSRALRDFPHQQHAELLNRGRRYDPHQVHRDFPARWQAYIRASFRNIAHVTQVFEVSERTARKWWAGETGAVGGHVAIAINEHPETAPAMLFAAE